MKRLIISCLLMAAWVAAFGVAAPGVEEAVAAQQSSGVPAVAPVVPSVAPSVAPSVTAPSAPGQTSASTPLQTTASDYVLGPGDLVSVVVPNLETEFTGKTFRIDMSGDLTLPYAGRVHAAGLTAGAIEKEMCTRLSRFLKDPEVVVSVSTYGSQPVSILGSVNNPGIRQIEGRKSLFEVLSLAGGLRPDAGYLIRITRDMKWGPIPLPSAQVDPSGRTSSASVKVRNIVNAGDASENITILPGDSISIPRAEVVYAVGSVTKAGGFTLNEHEALSALQVLSLAEGLQRTAASDKAKIVRTVEGSGDRVEIPVNLKLLLAGKGSDVSLRAGDILFVPSSGAKTAGYRTLDAITAMASGALIYTR